MDQILGQAGKRTPFCLEGLPDIVLDIVTSYLLIQDTISLIKASNRILRHKLLHQGGITTISVFPKDFFETAEEARAGVAYVTDPFIPRISPRLPYWSRILASSNSSVQSTPLHIRRPPPSFGFFERRSGLTSSSGSLTSSHEMKDAVSNSSTSTITSFTYVNPDSTYDEKANRFLPFGSPLALSDLPSTLTHLDYDANAYESPFPSSIQTLFPNLVHLSLLIPLSPKVRERRPSNFIPSLPHSLLSLRLTVDDILDILSPSIASLLPPRLTQLALYDSITETLRRRYSYPILLPSHFSSPLPSSITDLQLPNYTYDVTTGSGPAAFFPKLSLTSCALYWVSAAVRPFLPRSLTHLFMYNELQSSGDNPQWPKTLKSLKIQIRSCLAPISYQSSLTRIIVINDIVTDVKLKTLLSSTAISSLTDLQLPKNSFLESTLLSCPPTLKFLVVQDVTLQGITLPGNLINLDSLEVMASYFVSKLSKTTRITVTSKYPFDSVKFIHLPSSLQTFTTPTLKSGSDIELLPRNLKKISGLYVGSQDWILLPKALTSISFAPIFNDTSIVSLEYLRSLLPQLSFVSGGRFALSSLHLPPSLFVKGPPLASLHIPLDMQDGFYKYHADMHLEDVTLRTEKTSFDKAHSTFNVRDATFEGQFDFGSTQLHAKTLQFLPGLTSLNLEKATLGQIKTTGGSFPTFPKLPDTLLTLRLGPAISIFVIWHDPAYTVLEFPKNLKYLGLRLELAETRNWEPHPGLPKGLQALEIWSKVSWIFEAKCIKLPPFLYPQPRDIPTHFLATNSSSIDSWTISLLKSKV